MAWHNYPRTMGGCLSFLVDRKSNQVREVVGDTEEDVSMERITHITVDIQERRRRGAQQAGVSFLHNITYSCSFIRNSLF